IHYRATDLPDSGVEGALLSGAGSTPGTDGLIRVSRQGEGTEDQEQPGQERSPNDVAEPMKAKIQPAEGNDHHAGTHQSRRQGLHSTAPSDRDARSDDSEQRADPGHVPRRKRMMSGTQ